MDENTLREIIQQAGLTARTDELLTLAQNSIRLAPHPVAETDLPLGTSKLGGLPDLPPQIAWPQLAQADHQALSFLAQINLSETAAYDLEHRLPPTGLLYFFHVASPYGYSEDPSSWRVLYYEGDLSQLERRAAPANLPPKGQFTSCALEFASQPMLPDSNSAEFDGFSWLGLTKPHLQLDEAEMNAYEAALYQLLMQRSASNHEVITHLLGYAEQIQDNVLTEAYVISTGIEYAQMKAQPAAEKQQTAAAIDEWRLLLQLDSEGEARMMWGDLGRLYFCIRANDLAARHFANVWVVFQCG